MSEGHRHHFFHRHRKDEDDDNFNSNYAYGSGAAQGPDVSSDYDTSYFDHNSANYESQYGSGYNPTGNDFLTRSDGYKDYPDYQTGSASIAGNDYQTGSGYNAGGDFQKGYNAGKDYQKGYDAGKDYQKGYDAASYNGGSDYRQGQLGENYGRTRMEEKDDTRMEHVGELGAMTAGGFALFEKHEAKTDPVHARRHRIEEEVAAAAAVSSAGYALHENHQKKASGKASGGRKHHRRFF